MGNNHDQYFGKDKRKIIVLGLEGSGKTTLVNYIISEKVDFNTQKTKNLNILDKKIENLHITLFDLGGAERQRIFWKQQYQGTQGVIFVIDSEKYQNEKSLLVQQIIKLSKHIDSEVPFCICLNKIQKIGIMGSKIKNQLQKEISSSKKKFKIFQLDFKKKDQIKQMMSWFLNQTKPI